MNEQETGGERADTAERSSIIDPIMKILTKLALALAMALLITARADWVSGHFRSNGTYKLFTRLPGIAEDPDATFLPAGRLL